MTNRAFEMTMGGGWHSCRMEIGETASLVEILDVVTECTNAILTLCRGYIFRGQEIKYEPMGLHGADDPLKQRAAIVVTMFFDNQMMNYHGRNI